MSSRRRVRQGRWMASCDQMTMEMGDGTAHLIVRGRRSRVKEGERRDVMLDIDLKGPAAPMSRAARLERGLAVLGRHQHQSKLVRR